MKIILDTDIGSEMTDAAALCLAAISPEIELLGVSTVTHDTVFRASVAKKFLQLFGKNNVPVSAGFGNGGEHVWEKRVVFPEGYKVLELDKRQGYELILDMVNENKNDIVLVGIGTTTNIAKALEIDPELPKKVSRLVLMGGMINPPVVYGQQIPIGFEYNFCNDNVSATKIIQAGFKLTLLLGDLTFDQNDPWMEEDLEELKNIQHPATQLLVAMKNQSMVEMKNGIEKAGLPASFAKPWVNDEFVISYLIKPEFFETKDTFISWKLEGKYPRIQIAEQGYPVTFITKIDFVKTRKFIINGLKI
jgi:purine nucleosidase